MKKELNRPLTDLTVGEFIRLVENRSDWLQDNINIDQACELTGYAKKSLYAFVFRGHIPYFKSGGRLRFSRKKLIEWMSDK